MSETFLVLSRNERDMIVNVNRSSCEITVTLLRSYWNPNFLDRFSKNTKHQISFKSVPVGAKLFHADGHMDRQTDRRADMTKLIVTFRSYANATKMCIIHAEIYTSALFLFRDNVVGIATRYGLNGPRIESRWCQIFCTRPDQPWGPPSLLYSAYWGIPGGGGVKWTERGVDHPPPSSAKVEERVKLYHYYYSSGPLWPVLGRT